MKRWLILAMMGGALGGCAAMRKADSPVTMRLSPSFPAPAQARAGSVEVAPVQARGIAAAARYAYVDAAAPGEVRQAKSFFWEEPPPRVLQSALVAGLRTRFAPVAVSGLGERAERRVVATLTRFEETDAGADAHAVVAFEAVVMRANKIESSRDFCASAPISGASGTARAHAFESAIETATGDLVQAMATGTAPSPRC